jgi:hypothetical protein
MKKLKIIRGDTLNIVIAGIDIKLDDSSSYEITDEDKFTFSICMPRNNPILQKSFPEDMQLKDGNTLVFSFLPEQTQQLKCLNYDYDCKFDLKGKGDQVYTIAKGEIQVYETATKLAGGDG